MKTREKLIEQAQNIKMVEDRIIKLKLQKIKSKHAKKESFRISESIRTYQSIRQGLLEAYWS